MMIYGEKSESRKIEGGTVRKTLESKHASFSARTPPPLLTTQFQFYGPVVVTCADVIARLRVRRGPSHRHVRAKEIDLSHSASIYVGPQMFFFLSEHRSYDRQIF